MKSVRKYYRIAELKKSLTDPEGREFVKWIDKSEDNERFFKEITDKNILA